MEEALISKQLTTRAEKFKKGIGEKQPNSFLVDDIVSPKDYSP